MEKAIFGAGCFWQVEEIFDHLDGVISTKVGYMGGHVDKPTYGQVCGGDSGHTEVVEITFDPSKVSFEKLLDLFFSIHDPTQKNRQGPDIGFQYRSVIFAENETQKKDAVKKIEELKKQKPIVTIVEDHKTFYLAEEYHQKYIQKKKGHL